MTLEPLKNSQKNGIFQLRFTRLQFVKVLEGRQNEIKKTRKKAKEKIALK